MPGPKRVQRTQTYVAPEPISPVGPHGGFFPFEGRRREASALTAAALSRMLAVEAAYLGGIDALAELCDHEPTMEGER